MQKAIRYIHIAILLLFSIVIIYKSYNLSIQDGGTDLRTRIVGARLLATEHSPYFYKWQHKDSDRLLNPNEDPKAVLLGNSVTPAVMFVIYPFSQLPYSTIRILWTCLEIIAAALLMIFIRKRQASGTSLLAITLTVLGLFASDIWLLHVDRGQLYIFFTLYFAIIYYCYTSTWKHGQLVSGILAGLFIFFRPYAGIIALAFFLQKRNTWLKGWVIGIVAGLIIFVAPNPGVWQEYLNSMQEFSKEMVGAGQVVVSPELIRPVSIEGTTNLTHWKDFNLVALVRVADYFKVIGINISDTASIGIYALLVILLSVLFIWKAKPTTDPARLFLFAFLVYFGAELNFIAPRAPYNVIQWAFPLLLIIPRLKMQSFPFLFLIIALLFLHGLPLHLPYQVAMAESIFIGLSIYIMMSASTDLKLDDGNSRTQ